MARERDVERALVLGVRAMHGMCWKMMPTVAGIPDRLVILPNGRIVLVELKAPGGRLRPIQQVMHERLAAIGVDVVLLTGVDQVKIWLSGAERSTT